MGKSTLMNQILGQKVAAVSPRPQTTRRKQLGILTLDQAQVIFVDTPGIHQPKHKLGEFMNQEALATLADADVILWIVDSSIRPTDEDKLCARYLGALKNAPPVFLVINKIDKLPESEYQIRASSYLPLYPNAKIFYISATQGTGVEELLQSILESLPIGPKYYDEDQITNLYEREIAADLIREAGLLHLKEEVPHGLAVEIEEYKEREDSGAYIAATLHVEKESHKGIVIGKGGQMLKMIGSTAREEIEKMSGRKVYLELHVKVSKNWRDSQEAIRRFGYSREE